MLTHIHIRDFAIIELLELELSRGMTALTGETGAGKSILVDALGLALGDRADSRMVRHGAERAEVAADFSIADLPAVSAWLAGQELDADGDCHIRRVVNREGRSRAYINGRSVSRQQLCDLGIQLVDIHGQHEHQSLLRNQVQQELLDEHAGHGKQLQNMATQYRKWNELRNQIDQLGGSGAEREARLDLLRFQVQELDALAIMEEEWEKLGEEQTRLSHAGRLQETCERGLNTLYDEEDGAVWPLLSRTQAELEELALLDPDLESVCRLLNEALIQTREGVDELRHYTERLELDPARQHEVEQRLDSIHEMARKHRCRPGDLPARLKSLRTELNQLENADQQLDVLRQRLGECSTACEEAAQKLHKSRLKAARDFSKQVTDGMQGLGMPGGSFRVDVHLLENADPTGRGRDRIEFQVSANAGQPVQALSRVASGGELSRISLAIQVIAAHSTQMPTLIFDEVDTGIGGGVAERVGRLLGMLGRNRQVLCVTHLPQVAAQANEQLQVSKISSKTVTRTSIRRLAPGERIDELARMLGGIEITDSSRAHAREMLTAAGIVGNPAVKRARGRKKQLDCGDTQAEG